MHESLYQYFLTKTNLSPSEFAQISEHFKYKKVKRGHILIAQGEVCHHLYFVVKGCLRFFATGEDGKENTRYFAFEQKFGTALTSFIENKISFESIQSLEVSELLVIDRDNFYRLVETNKYINLIYRGILEMAYVTSQRRIYGLQGDTALDRLKWLLEYQPSIMIRLPHKIIASYLGVTPYTLSRLKASLYN